MRGERTVGKKLAERSSPPTRTRIVAFAVKVFVVAVMVFVSNRIWAQRM
jgi:hypothetical protein